MEVWQYKFQLHTFVDIVQVYCHLAFESVSIYNSINTIIIDNYNKNDQNPFWDSLWCNTMKRGNSRGWIQQWQESPSIMHLQKKNSKGNLNGFKDEEKWQTYVLSDENLLENEGKHELFMHSVVKNPNQVPIPKEYWPFQVNRWENQQICSMQLDLRKVLTALVLQMGQALNNKRMV